MRERWGKRSALTIMTTLIYPRSRGTLRLASADPRYASRTVDIQVDYDGRRCQWIVTDQGNGFDFEQVMKRDPTSPEELFRLSGRGILMMRAFLREQRGLPGFDTVLAPPFIRQ